MSAPDVDALFAEALAAHAARDTNRSIALAREVIALDASHTRALEHLATLLVTRKHRFEEGLRIIDDAVNVRPDDPGLWYAVGWLAEFAAHESRRTEPASDVTALYRRAEAAFRRCLELHPDGKLQGDAEDLLDHVENELANL